MSARQIPFSTPTTTCGDANLYVYPGLAKPTIIGLAKASVEVFLAE